MSANLIMTGRDFSSKNFELLVHSSESICLDFRTGQPSFATQLLGWPFAATVGIFTTTETGPKTKREHSSSVAGVPTGENYSAAQLTSKIQNITYYLRLKMIISCSCIQRVINSLFFLRM